VTAEPNQNLPQQEILRFSEPLYFINERTEVGHLSQLALEVGDWAFSAVHERDKLYTVTHESGVSFLAELKKGRGKNKGTYTIKGCVRAVDGKNTSFFDSVNINGKGENGYRLRPAQLGAVCALMAHWSLSKEVATVVLPTGTVKRASCYRVR
jgi:hypothetical protein